MSGTHIEWHPPAALGWLFIVLAIAAVLYAVWVYRRTHAPLTGTMRGFLTGIRALLLVLLLAVLCRPVLSIPLPGGAARGVLLLFDRSQSMSLPSDLPGVDGSRDDLVKHLRQELSTRLSEEFPVYHGVFSAVAEPWDDQEPLPSPSGPATHLSDAIEAAPGLSGGGKPGAVILLTDGVQTHGDDPVSAARRLGIPVGSVMTASGTPVQDLSMVRVRANREAFVNEPTPVEAVLRLQELEDAQVNVSLWDVTEEPIELDSEKVTVRSGGAEQVVPLQFEPARTGVRFLEVRVETLDGEANSANNKRMVALTVNDQKTGVLLLSGRLTWEHTFLKRALEADSTLDMDSGYWRNGKFHGVSGAVSTEALRDYKLVVLDQVEPSQLGNRTARVVKDYVAGGGGLIVLNGAAERRLDQWRGSALAEVLPVGFGSKGPLDEVSVRVTANARRHPLMDPAVPGAAPLEAWADLPPVQVCSGIGAIKGTAEALLVASTSDGRDLPVMTWGSYEKGNVLLLSGGGYWRWMFTSSSRSSGGEAIASWWRRSAKWLAQPQVDTRLEVRPVDFVTSHGRQVSFVGRALDQNFQGIPGTSVSMQVASVEDTLTQRELSLSGRDGFLKGDLQGLSPGRYQYRATVAAEDQVLGVVGGSFAVDSVSTELSRLEGDLEQLQTIAEATGSRVWHPDSLDQLMQDLKLAGQADVERKLVDLWAHPLTFGIFVGLAGTEWWLRRRRGLI